MNDAKYNQRRLAVAKFMGELYNYRLVDSALVFKVRTTMHNAHYFFSWKLLFNAEFFLSNRKLQLVVRKYVYRSISVEQC